VINLVTGLPIWECILFFMGFFTTSYTGRWHEGIQVGGMKAVIWTDVIQFATVLLGIVADLLHRDRPRERRRLSHIPAGA
jgi:Na+/proline symporter